MTIKIGFIGAGRITKGHMERLSAMEDVQLAAYADLDEAAAQAAADRFGGRAFTSAERMLDEVPLDGVYICIPPFAHGAPERAVLARGLPMFVEKPVHLDIGEARDLAAEIERRGLVTSVGYQERYLDIVDRLKAFLAGRQVGLALGYWMGLGPQGGWWVQKAKSGGQAVEQTTHVFDLARYLLGEVRTVQAVGRTGLRSHIPGNDVEDASAANLVFESGVIATIFSGCFAEVRKQLPNGLDIFCTDAVAKYRRRRSVWLADADGAEEVENQNAYQVDADRAFIEAIAHNDRTRVRSSYADGVRTLEVTLAVNAAMASGGSVELPLASGRDRRRAV